MRPLQDKTLIDAAKTALASTQRMMAERGLSPVDLQRALCMADPEIASGAVPAHAQSRTLTRILSGGGITSALWHDIAGVLGVPLSALCTHEYWHALVARAVRHRGRFRAGLYAGLYDTPARNAAPSPQPALPLAPEPPPPTTQPDLAELAARLSRLTTERAHIDTQIAATKDAMRAALA